MSGFDILVLAVVGLASTYGFMRGFVQEAISLFAWVFVIFAIHNLHSPLADVLAPRIGSPSGANVLAFFLLLVLPYAIVRGIARWLGSASRGSVLAPVDRVLGFGFGAVKGTVVIVLAYSLVILGYDTVWGPDGRPGWITNARTYRFVDASSEAMVKMISERRKTAVEAAQNSEAKPEAPKRKPQHHKAG